MDTIYRRYQLTAEQAIKEFGADKVSKKIRDAAAKKPDDKFEFLHCIFPRENYVVNARLAKNLRFASYNVEVSGKLIVRESGYHEFPLLRTALDENPRHAVRYRPGIRRAAGLQRAERNEAHGEGRAGSGDRRDVDCGRRRRA